ncbi:MAG: SseB family protein [Rhodobacteraceae bacterium]|nr:SseB family protein [Paracoccaceae bacterium]MCB1406247.1 SseB family protein [Paracoccaceae bacterium]MCB1408136.1 SseB family protein [Paracoccaceae bacterium]MCC0078656.1 SseB family protein [Rhodobacter sp.]
MPDLPEIDLPETDLDLSLRRMAAAPEDTTRRLALHAELTRSEVFVLLEAEVTGETLEPRVFTLSDGPAVLAFDSEMRLAGFAGAAAYAALPGRVLVPMLAGAGLSLLLNPDADHAALLDPQALTWLADTLAAPAPETAQAVPDRIGVPALDPAVMALLVPALERRLAGLPGLQRTVLAAVRWRGGGQGHVLALSGLPESAHPPVARAVAEALALSGLEAGALDVIFPPDAAMARIAGVGLILSPAPPLPVSDQIVTADSAAGANPGLDPSKPPKLR